MIHRAVEASSGTTYRARLEDGTQLLFRLIRPADKDLLARGFTELSDRSRYERFFSHLKGLSEAQLRYLTEVDHEDHSAWVAIVPGNSEGARGVGVGRWVRLPQEPTVAEVAVTVIDAFHRRGIGRTLMYLAAVSALAKGISTFQAWVLGDNKATLRMFELMGATQGGWEEGIVELRVSLSAAVDRPELVPLDLEPVQP
jgi:L-amino acid N-acyltransferase YncA